jgi:hypothetical protein
MALYKVNLTSFYGCDIVDALAIEKKVYNFDEGWEITENDNPVYVGQTAMFPFDSRWPKEAPGWIASGGLTPITQEEYIEQLSPMFKFMNSIVDQAQVAQKYFLDWIGSFTRR